MVYLSHIKCMEKPDFDLQILVNDSHTFAEFHLAIQKACGFNPDQLASFFYLPGLSPSRKVEISQTDAAYSGFANCTMEKTQLKNLLRSEQEHLLYVFDLIQDRSFDIELTRLFMKKDVLEPSITSMNGEAPAQVLEEELQDDSAESFSFIRECYDYGDLDDYTEIFGEMEDLQGGN